MSTEKGLAKSTAIVSSGIMGSRILGFVREILFAKFFGMGNAIQAFLMAFTIPNALRELAAEGAVNTALVPVLAECDQKKGRKEFWRLSNVIFNLFLVILSVIVIIGILGLIFTYFSVIYKGYINLINIIMVKINLYGLNKILIYVGNIFPSSNPALIGILILLTSFIIIYFITRKLNVKFS